MRIAHVNEKRYSPKNLSKQWKAPDEFSREGLSFLKRIITNIYYLNIMTTEHQKKFIPKFNLEDRFIKAKQIIVGESQKERRANLLANAASGLGKCRQVGRNLSYTVGNDREGYIEYVIVNAINPLFSNTNTSITSNSQ